MSGGVRTGSKVAIVALAVAAGNLAANAAPAPVRDAFEQEYEEAIARLEKESAALAPEKNAAHYYRKAFAALPKTENKDLDDFLKRPLPVVPPETIDEMPGAKKEIRKYEKAVTEFLRRGASLKRCTFDLDWRAGAGMLMPHLLDVRVLARRAVCWGKLLELEKKPREAARAYLDVIRMGCHMDQDPALISLLVGIASVGIGAPAIEGLLSRGVDAETAGYLLEELRKVADPPFHASRAVDAERFFMVGWARREYLKLVAGGRKVILQSLKGTDVVLKRLGGGLGDHKPWKVPEDPNEIRRLLEEAFETYKLQTKLISRAMEGPYHETRRRVERLSKVQGSYWRGQTEEGYFACALVCWLMGDWPAFHAHLARAEARLAGLKLLAAACLAKAETGKYPGKLDALKQYFPRGLPKDPFTGSNFSYWLAGGLPAAACEGDDPKLRKEHPEYYHFGLSYRRELEEHELKKWRAQRD